ncbi:MAG: peptide chain release factor 2 [Candidatus Magasanikbacteria bacterium RIFOXYD2_FULL_39_9]|uniref:Peptide chain release factor 2 n=1 Tax=Candidatus Magasanikbacteria bacterium RIFOXYD1_FULL_40_23 TaxID=1798705 RepID=A0A1F6P9G4_9BACT|nr:MAG: peptide chain release factor 2 [Candidatus Magasanikbacteria bacterium RIFOXYD2_FULL_39_9]OGH92806.1 MAG: peptide chain release factor 2 [Candidatus Magasanikbacteria bacterium RIFOXYD1_FULL_40_23]
MSVEDLHELQSKIKDTKKLLNIDDLQKKLERLAEEMNAQDFWSNQETAQVVSQDYQDIKKEIEKFADLEKRTNDLLELSQSDDNSLVSEIDQQTKSLQKEFADYEFLVLLSGPYDKNNVILSIHAGAGGTEAQDWAEMLLRMITRFSDKMGWQTRILDESRGAEAGYKSVMLEIKGRFAYGYLKSEHGVHRLVRISPFDAEKMRHTSFALIEVLPELDDRVKIEIDPKDIRIDTFMSGGKGGQSVNTTYSAVRIVHIPTNISVSCQNERSQQQNKDTAMKILQSKLNALEEEKKAKERLEMRGEYKSAEWGNQIRSYVLHPYHLVKDNRTEYESADPESVLEGELLPLSEAYLKWIKT